MCGSTNPSNHWRWVTLPPEDVFVNEMGMAETYNPDMEKSKEYRKWLKAPQARAKSLGKSSKSKRWRP